MRIRLSDEAREFLNNEARYLKARSSSAAHRFLDRIEEAKKNLSLFPLMESEAEGPAMRGARRLVTGDYILIYDIADDTVAISSIRHGRMKPKARTVEKDFDYEAPDNTS